MEMLVIPTNAISSGPSEGNMTEGRLYPGCRTFVGTRKGVLST